MTSGRTDLAVSQEYLDQILDCYLPHVRYLKAAHVEFGERGEPFESELGGCVAVARGEFRSVPAWYIRDTGHFNSIEFNICYNQLAFVLVGQCIERGVVSALSAQLPKQEFRERMLPDLVISRYSVNFERPMQALDFCASFGIMKVISKMGRLFLQTRCWVGPAQDRWCARGEVMLAVVRSVVAESRASSTVDEHHSREMSVQ